jgi:hypothetical protein
MFKNLFLITATLIFCGLSQNVLAKELYPNITGSALFEYRFDRITSTDKANADSNNGTVNVDTEFALNFNKNWSLINDWKFRQTEDIDQNNPERYRSILSSNRGFTLNDEGLIIEQLKGQFENEDARFFFGKFNPTFGSAFKKKKRIGVFTTDFTKDYELREKIGAGFTALLERSEITASTFFNDTSSLSNSAINKRGRQNKVDGLAGDTSSPTSYTIAIEGQDLFGMRDLFYNFGYRNLDVDKIAGRDDETGFAGGLEYLIHLGSKTSLIPFVEIASMKNLGGELDRNVTYSTVALVGKYSSWTASVSNVTRDIRQKNLIGNKKDRQMQYSIGYKFSNNIVADITKADIKEDGNKASLIGFVVSYIYNF